MQIQEVIDVVALDCQPRECVSAGSHYRIQVSVGLLPLSVYVTPAYVAATITVHDAVDIDHRHYLEYVLVQEEGSVWTTSHQILETPFHYERADSL